MGIAGLICAFFLPPVGVVLGIVSLSQARKAGGSKGVGIAAIIIGSVLTIIGIAILVWLGSFVAALCTTYTCN